MDESAGLLDEARKLALDRFRLLRLHLEENQSLRSMPLAAGIPYRTTHRWIRMARYPRFYSRIGFVHEFRPLGAAEIRQLMEQRWAPPGVYLLDQPLDPETMAAIIRMTAGNFGLLNRQLTQEERILQVNALKEVTKAVVKAARESLVIGDA